MLSSIKRKIVVLSIILLSTSINTENNKNTPYSSVLSMFDNGIFDFTKGIFSEDEVNGIFKIKLLPETEKLYLLESNIFIGISLSNIKRRFSIDLEEPLYINSKKKLAFKDKDNKVNEVAYYPILLSEINDIIYVKCYDFTIDSENILPLFIKNEDFIFGFGNKESLQYAIMQTYFSKKMLYYPNKELIDEIVELASRFDQVFNKIFENNDKEALSFLRRYETEESILEFVRSFKVLSNYKWEENKVLANEIKAVVQLSRQIGKFITEYPMLKNQALGKSFTKFYSYLGVEHSIDYHSSTLFMTEGKIFAINKRTEQIDIEENDPIWKKKPFTGVYAVGNLIDNFLFSELSEEQKQKREKWPYCLLNKGIKETVTEPLKCHMSSSYFLSFYVMNMILGVETKELYIGNAHLYEKKNRFYSSDSVSRRSILIISTMISIGYHSAIEVLEHHLFALGINLRDDSKYYDYHIPLIEYSLINLHFFNSGNTSRMISYLMNNLSNNPKEILISPIIKLPNDIRNFIMSGEYFDLLEEENFLQNLK